MLDMIGDREDSASLDWWTTIKEGEACRSLNCSHQRSAKSTEETTIVEENSYLIAALLVDLRAS